MNKNTSKRSTKKTAVRTILTVVALAIAVMFLLEVTNRTHYFHKAASVSAPTTPIEKLPKSPAPAVKTPSGGSTDQKGTPSDQNGQAPTTGVSTNPDDWATSASRLITLKSPLKNAVLQTGFTLTGATSVASQVQYRLIDDNVGVISEGPINVVNGNFSAAINFASQSKTGRLDVFNTDDSGRELNEVQITVRF